MTTQYILMLQISIILFLMGLLQIVLTSIQQEQKPDLQIKQL